MLNLAQSQSRAKLRPCPAQPEQETSSRCKPWRKVSVSDAAHRTNQNQASLGLLPACTMNLFLGPRARGEGWFGVGGPCGSMNKVGYRSVVLVNQRHPGQESPYMDVRQLIITIATREKLLCILLEMHTCASFASV